MPSPIRKKCDGLYGVFHRRLRSALEAYLRKERSRVGKPCASQGPTAVLPYLRDGLINKTGMALRDIHVYTP